MRSFMARVPTRLSSLSHYGISIGPLAGLSARETSPDMVLFVSGMAVLSAGLVVLRTAHANERPLARMAPARVAAVGAKRLYTAEEALAERETRTATASSRRLYTAEEALAERQVRASDREVLLGALAAAAETFYSIAGHLPRDASDRALGNADDLRELVWLNRR